MERGFLDYSDKKKKEGGAKEDDGAIPILGDLAKRVKNIEGKTTMPKGILKKAVRNVSSDTHEVVMPLNDVGSGSKVNFEAVGKSNANSSSYTTDIRNLGSDLVGLATNEELSGDAATNIDKPSSSSGAQRTMGSEQEVFTSNDGPKTGNSFASLLRSNEANNKVHFRTLVNEERVESVDCVLPKAAAAKVKSRYENSIVGFFVGKDPSFPVVQQYVSNTWRKFGFEKITRNDDGVYLFKFASKSGMDQVLEKGPWMIRKSPIILNKWSPSVSLKKGEVTKVPVWVKLYNVPVLAYSEDGLSLIATQIGKPIMLDAFTSSMFTMAISDEEGDGYTKEVIRVVYEWKPPHCVNCQTFGHDPNLCPKLVREKIPKTSAMDVKANTMEENDDGFVEQKKGVDAKGGSNSASPSVSTNDNEKGNGCLKLDLNLSNPFDVLNVEGEEMGDSGQQPKVSEHVGTKSLNVNKKKAQEPSSSKSAINDVQKDKNVSSSPALKTWDCINESDTDDEDVIPSYGSSLGGGNRLEDKDFDFSDGYEDQVVDFPSQLKEFRDFKLSMCGRK
ncbi:retrovirus-related pol polyprotein from transposon TNT 1-94 [Tanacetum coccineum]